MAIINQSNILNLQPGITAPVVVHMSEGDRGTKLSFKLIDGARAWTDPGNVVAAVHGIRQDGTQFGPYACTISGDVVSFQTDAAIAAVAGSGIAQIVLTDSDQNTAGTANFAIMVERATFPMGVTYTNDRSVYEAILAYVESIPAAVVEDYKARIAEEAAERKEADLTLTANTEALQSGLASEIRDRLQQDTVLSARMDEFSKLPDGSLSTAADAELVDARVMEDGTTASTAGDAVREQTARLKSFMLVSDPTYISDATAWTQGSLRESTGAPIDSTTRCRTSNYIRLKTVQGNLCSISVKDGYKASWRAYSATETASYDADESVSYYFEGTRDMPVKPTYFYRFIVAKVDDSDITPEEVPTDVLAVAYYDQINTILRAEVDDAISKVYGNEYSPEYSIYAGGISSSGANNSSEYRARTQYIAISPGTSYFVELTNSDYSFTGSFTYGQAAQTSVVRRLTPLDGQHLFFTAEEGENAFRTAFYHTMRPDSLAFTEEERTALKDYINIRRTSTEGYLGKTGTFEFFTVTVDRPLSYGSVEVTDATKQEEVECVLRLPDSYSPIGTPTRLVLACHGASGYVDAANNYWYSNNGWPPFMDSLLAAGYAVFDSNVLPTSYGTEVMGRGMGSPAYINVLKKAYDYIQSNYNVYPEIFAHGTSMGGLGASAFSKAYPELVLAESSFAGRDLSQYINYMRTGEYFTDDDLAKVWGYDTMADLTADKWSHIEGCAPVLSLHKLTNGVLEYPPDRATDFDNWLAYYSSIDLLGRNDAIGEVTAIRPSVPYKTWDSWADNAYHTKAKFVLQKAFRANGFIYEVVAYDDYSHDQMCYGKVEDMRNQLLAWYKRWE